jgi:ELWxxDGT repeat protein
MSFFRQPIPPRQRSRTSSRPGPRPLARSESLEPRTLLSVSLLSDVDPSTGDAIPDDARLNQPVISGGLAYFVANDGQTGPGLWRSDGTAAGTFLLKDITPGPYGSSPTNLTDVNGTLYFTAAGTWRTDGTPAGTVRVPGDPATERRRHRPPHLRPRLRRRPRHRAMGHRRRRPRLPRLTDPSAD